MTTFVVAVSLLNLFSYNLRFFFLKDLIVGFNTCFIPDSLVLIFHINIAGPLLLMLFESALVLTSLRSVRKKVSYLKETATLGDLFLFAAKC